MPQKSIEVAVLLADISGSTPLYERVGDAAAVLQIGECLDRLRSIADQEGGRFVRSRGDDVLCTFADPASALKAARGMLSSHSSGSLSIHAGGHFGQIIETHDDLFGDAVNLTARLAALATPGEFLVSRSFFERLPEEGGRPFRLLDDVAFKGRNAPAEVYSLLEDDGTTRTKLMSPPSGQKLLVTLRYKDNSHHCNDRQIMSIGRAPECDLVIGQPWISRRHAVVTVRRGKVAIEDRSSSGTYVTIGNGRELFMHRESALLTGSGIISPAMRPSDAGAEIVHYEIIQSDRIWDVGKEDR